MPQWLSSWSKAWWLLLAKCHGWPSSSLKSNKSPCNLPCTFYLLSLFLSIGRGRWASSLNAEASTLISQSYSARKDVVTMATPGGRVSAPSAGGKSTKRPGRSRSRRTGSLLNGKRCLCCMGSLCVCMGVFGCVITHKSSMALKEKPLMDFFFFFGRSLANCASHGEARCDPLNIRKTSSSWNVWSCW